MKLLLRRSTHTRTSESPAQAAGLSISVAPAAVEVTPRQLRLGDGFNATFAVTGYPAEVGYAWLQPLLAWPGRMDLAVHIDPIPSHQAASQLKNQRARLESSRRSDLGKGRLSDPATEAAAHDAAELASRVARGQSKLFSVGVYVTVHARTEDGLATAVAQVKAAAASTLLELQPVTWRHLQGWISTLPLGHDGLQIRRIMDSAAIAASFPLSSPDLPGPLPGDPAAGGGVLYGLNPDSSGIVMWDRWSCDNHNMVVLAASGAGKSYFVKCELLRHLYDPRHPVTASVIDPEDEYGPLARNVGGTTIALGAPGVRVNPFDLPAGDHRPDVLSRKALFLHTLVGVMLGGTTAGATLTAGERAALDRAILAVYAKAGITPDPKTHRRRPPLLKHLAACLHADNDSAATQLAARLAPWAGGSYSDLFAGPSTEDPDSHLTVWSLRHLPDEIRGVGTLLALEHIWRAIDRPSSPGGPRRLVVVDEAWLLMRTGDGATFLYRMAKAARKRHAGLTLVTQDAADVLGSELGLATVSNAATQILLRQAPQAIHAVGQAFGLTDGEKRLLLAAQKGTGLLLSGTSRSRFEAIASPKEHLLASGPAPGAGPDSFEDPL